MVSSKKIKQKKGDKCLENEKQMENLEESIKKLIETEIPCLLKEFLVEKGIKVENKQKNTGRIYFKICGDD